MNCLPQKAVDIIFPSSHDGDHLEFWILEAIGIRNGVRNDFPAPKYSILNTKIIILCGFVAET